MIALFLVVKRPSNNANELNKYLNRTDRWANQWKITFIHSLLKQTQHVVYSRNVRKVNLQVVFFNNNSTVDQITTLKHLGI